jgi:hypothetical protein
MASIFKKVLQREKDDKSKFDEEVKAEEPESSSEEDDSESEVDLKKKIVAKIKEDADDVYSFVVSLV